LLRESIARDAIVYGAKSQRSTPSFAFSSCFAALQVESQAQASATQNDAE
jgi:hypothetical protein